MLCRYSAIDPRSPAAVARALTTISVVRPGKYASLWRLMGKASARKGPPVVWTEIQRAELLGQHRLSAAERGHFLAYAARVMRSVDSHFDLY